MTFIKKNAKALVLLGIIVLAGVGQSVGLDLNLDVEHYISLLVADGLVWAVPNKGDETVTIEGDASSDA